ncbi:MAG TPA: hypothetical protein QGF58_16805 [Myxococcota bacterium]|nr:hypothetical protein [Myxococcota bacterium]
MLSLLLNSAIAGPFALEADGYGQVDFGWHDYGADQTGQGGSPPDSRLVFDQTRFVLELEGEAEGGWAFEAELEVEHGGTGAALELEFEEFGEYENEVEAGGEVVLEQLFLAKSVGPHVTVKAGRLYVAFGQLYTAHRPTDLVALRRPEAEITVVPATWDEMGLSVELRRPSFELTGQVVNSLDSTGFSSQSWVASGHQRRFEEVRATSLAGVFRVDFVAVSGLVAGTSAWFGGTTGNRPKADMAGVFAPLLLVDAHIALNRGPLRANGALIWGSLSEAPLISEKNRRLSNNLDVLRSPVANQGLAAWVEVGVDVLPAGGHRLEPHLRLQRYDTMFRTDESIFDNPRFERTVSTAGLAYSTRDTVAVSLDAQRRVLGSDEFRPEHSVLLSFGFIYQTRTS